MEVYMIFLWLEMAFLAIQIGFIVGGLLSKNRKINLPVVLICMFLIWAMMVGVLFTQ